MWAKVIDSSKKIYRFVAQGNPFASGSIAAAVIGFIAFMLSPVKQKMHDYLWPPHPTVANELISIHKPVLRGDKFIIRLHLVAEPGQNLPRGIIQVKVNGDQLVNSSSAVVDIDGNESSKDLEFDFGARTAGEGHVTYEYTSNQRPIAIQPVEVTIADLPNGCIPRVEDVSGCWHVQWGSLFGEIEVSVGQHGKLTGTFDLINNNDGEARKGSLDGYINGANVYLILAGKGSRHRLIANLLEVQGRDRLELCGTMNDGSAKPFKTGGILEADADEAKVCNTANFRAFARSQ
jgi:hypothetical protein